MLLEIGKAKVEVTQSGSGARACLLLHGWGCSAQMMENVRGALEGQMRVAAIDFPGHGKNGKSAPPPEPWGVPEYMEMTAEVIRRLSLAPCDIVAHSFGARVAILLAAEHPELVGRMVLTGAAGIPKPQSERATAQQTLYKGLKAGDAQAVREGDFARPDRQAGENQGPDAPVLGRAGHRDAAVDGAAHERAHP